MPHSVHKLVERLRESPHERGARTLLTLSEFDDRCAMLDRAEDSRWTRLRDGLHVPLMFVPAAVIALAFWAVERFWQFESYTDVFFGIGIACALVTFAAVISLFREMNTRARRAKKLGLTCGSCGELLVSFTETSGTEELANAVRETGRCQMCAKPVLVRSP